MGLTIHSLSTLLGIRYPGDTPNLEIRHLSFDSRRIIDPKSTLFFAFAGQRDGHDFLDEAHGAGVRCFVVQEGHALPPLSDSLILPVKNPIEALQRIAQYYRQSSITYPLLAITGSNGKTVVKEWLFHLLQAKMKIGRSPKSYNSQIGLPLSIWQLEADNDLGIIEAGISKKGEMAALEQIVQAEYGLLTSIGEAHDDGFASREEKVLEKLSLFKNCRFFVYPKQNEKTEKIIQQWAKSKKVRLISWGTDSSCHFHIEAEEHGEGSLLRYASGQIQIPFKDQASIENAGSCLAFMLALELPIAAYIEAFANLPNIDMRLQLLNGQFQSRLLNDAYSADISSLEIALQFQKKQAGSMKKTLILSSLQANTDSPDKKWPELKSLLAAYHIDECYMVGKDYFDFQPDFGIPQRVFESTSQLLAHIDPRMFQEQMVLIKGRRNFAFEKIVRLLEAQVHETVLEIDLNALEQNFLYYKNKVAPGTRIMGMVKAQGYGSGSIEIARQLQASGAHYLAVAYTDEGIQLRRNGISLPILIMNARRDSLAECLDYQLEPVVYDFDFLSFLQDTLDQSGIPQANIHLEFDTGMHRLGFSEEQCPEIIERIKKDSRISIASVFSHLAAADEAEHDAYTQKQLAGFSSIQQQILSGTKSKPLFHILNTAGIERFGHQPFDMVRPGIGLYGIESTANAREHLQPVATLKARISQVRDLTAGETVGYSRKGKLEKDCRIAVLSIGYADGFRRSLSNGKGHVWINGKLAPVVGNVCMDMVMVDISDIHCEEGDAVEIFGKNLAIESVAEAAETIPYEIITGISSRVNRIYFRE